MKKEELAQLENKLLSTDFPDAGNFNNGESANIGKKIKQKIKARPQRYLLYTVSLVCSIGIIIMGYLIIKLLFSQPTQSDMQIALDGFDYLVEQGKNETTMDTNIKDAPVDENGMTSYFVNPSIKNATLKDSYFQLGEKAYQLPITLSQLEADGVALITLGVQPPAEDVILNPQMRNGYIQFQNKRFAVTLKNGINCVYHDLTVVEIIAKEPGSPFYIADGLTIGSEEAAIPQTADRIEQDVLKYNTFYHWGSINNELSNKTGKRTVISVSNRQGKIEEISIFNDGTVSE